VFYLFEQNSVVSHALYSVMLYALDTVLYALIQYFVMGYALVQYAVVLYALVQHAVTDTVCCHVERYNLMSCCRLWYSIFIMLYVQVQYAIMLYSVTVYCRAVCSDTVHTIGAKKIDAKTKKLPILKKL
jgi:hypothetical protein